MSKKIILFTLFCIVISSKLNAQISLVNFSSGFTSPVDIKNCGDNRLFIVEQRGIIKIVDTAGVANAQPFLNIQTRVQLSSEQGLLGLAFPDDFLTSGYFYVNYTSKPNGRTTISRFHVDSLTPDSADPNSEEILLTIYQPYSNHNGGHVAFGPDGYLYIGMGDGGSGGDPQNRAQNPDSLLGKMLRIAVDPSDSTYSIPPDNPFALDTSLGRGEIWTLGMRNPWRWSFDPLTGDLWIGDVGQNIIEEIDMQPAGSPGGLNYGWRCYEANQVYNNNSCLPITNYVLPVHQYNHTPGGYCSVTGGYIYRGARFQELYAKYFYADYCNSQIQYLVANDSGGYTNTNLGSLGATSITTFGVDRNGELYCAGGSTIYRFVSADCSPVATINNGKDTIDDCGTTLVNLSVPGDTSYDYLWILNGDTMSTFPSLTATQAGMYYIYVANQACLNSDSVYVDFTSNLNLTFAGLDTLYCDYSQSSNLLPNYLGGTFTGPGITGATFNPTVAGIGTHIITYTYTNPAGCTYSTSQNARVDACLNVPENNWVNTISVFPNPAQGDFRVKAFAVSEKRIRMEMTDLAGRLVMIEEMALSIGENSIPVHADFSAGVYFVRFSDDQSSAALKMILQ